MTGVYFAREFGWTLEYTASLDPFQLADIMGVMDGLAKAQQK